jgi:murein DD-endopeptidase MepM/ murein hydrolase activator NlpD
VTPGGRSLLSGSFVAILAATPSTLAAGLPKAESVAPQASPHGIYRTLRPGMTLFQLSRIYGVSVGALMKANRIVDPTSIPAGSKIFVPGATARAAPSRTRFALPLRGRITSTFGATERRSHHTGIDIDGEEGDPIAAAADGRVARIDDDPKYGLLVILDHESGYATWYAHASEVLVREGDDVRRGQTIARVGDSGDARGTHLHFEVRLKDRPVDPLIYLDAGRSTASLDRRSAPRRLPQPSRPGRPRTGS